MQKSVSAVALAVPDAVSVAGVDAGEEDRVAQEIEVAVARGRLLDAILSTGRKHRSL